MVAAAGAPFAITSDVGGSTRIPAFFCGLFGHKPTGGTVSNAGCVPPVHGRVKKICQLGPTSRHARDLWPLLRVIAGPDQRDIEGTEHSHIDPGGPRPDQIKRGRVRVLNVEEVCGGTLMSAGPTKEGLAAQRRVVAWMRDEWGCEVEDVRIPQMTEAFDIWASMLGDAQPQPFATILNDGRVQSLWWPVWEFGRYMLGRSPHTFPGKARRRGSASCGVVRGVVRQRHAV